MFLTGNEGKGISRHFPSLCDMIEKEKNGAMMRHIFRILLVLCAFGAWQAKATEPDDHLIESFCSSPATYSVINCTTQGPMSVYDTLYWMWTTLGFSTTYFPVMNTNTKGLYSWENTRQWNSPSSSSPYFTKSGGDELVSRDLTSGSLGCTGTNCEVVLFETQVNSNFAAFDSADGCGVYYSTGGVNDNNSGLLQWRTDDIDNYHGGPGHYSYSPSNWTYHVSDLYSDASCDTPVSQWVIRYMEDTSATVPIHVDNGSAINLTCDVILSEYYLGDGTSTPADNASNSTFDSWIENHGLYMERWWYVSNCSGYNGSVSAANLGGKFWEQLERNTTNGTHDGYTNCQESSTFGSHWGHPRFTPLGYDSVNITVNGYYYQVSGDGGTGWFCSDSKPFTWWSFNNLYYDSNGLSPYYDGLDWPD